MITDKGSFYYDECKHIQQAFRNKGYDISLDEALSYWSDRSEVYCASWLGLHEDLEEVYKDIIDYTDAKEILDKRKCVNEIILEVEELLDGVESKNDVIKLVKELSEL